MSNAAELVADAEALVETGRKTIAGAGSLSELDDVERTLLARRRPSTRSARRSSPSTRANGGAVGQAMGAAREALTEALAARRWRTQRRRARRVTGARPPRLTLGGSGYRRGHMHPVTRIWRGASRTCSSASATRLPKVPRSRPTGTTSRRSTFPPGHPARAMQDTLYVSSASRKMVMLRTHTSPVQVRVMEAPSPADLRGRAGPDLPPRHSRRAPLAGLPSDRVSHVDRGITLGDLLEPSRRCHPRALRSEHQRALQSVVLPFTEPSVEFSMTCVFLRGRGLHRLLPHRLGRTGRRGHGRPQVFENVGIDCRGVHRLCVAASASTASCSCSTAWIT